MFKKLNSADKNDMDDDFSPSLKLYESSSSLSSGSEGIKEEATKIMGVVKSRNCRMSQLACVGLKFSSEMSFDLSDEEGDEHSQFSRSMSDISSFPSDDISEGTDNDGDSLRKGIDFDRDDESEETYYEGFQGENLLEKEKCNTEESPVETLRTKLMSTKIARRISLNMPLFRGKLLIMPKKVIGIPKKKYVEMDSNTGEFRCYAKIPKGKNEEPEWSLAWNTWLVQDVLNDQCMFYLYHKINDEQFSSNENISVRDFPCYKFKCPKGLEQKQEILKVAEYMDSELSGVKKANLFGQRIKRNRKIATRIISKVQKEVNKLAKSNGMRSSTKNLQRKELEIRALPEEAYPHMWFTIPELIKEMNKPSEMIKDLRGNKNSKIIGSLYVEVLTCVGLRRSYQSVRRASSTVALVCSDSIFRTEPIPHRTNPMWLCRGKRSVIFPLHDSFDKMYVGCYHHYSNSDDLIGRAVIEASKLRPETNYDIILPLRESGDVYDRIPRGAVRLRLQLRWLNERAMVLSIPKYYLSSRKKRVVSVENDRDFKQITELIHGKSIHHIRYVNRDGKAVRRENKLYRKEFMKFLARFAIEIFTWQHPPMSTYVFSTWMICIYYSSIALTIPSALGALLVCLGLSYDTFVLDKQRSYDFTSPNFSEIVRALILNSSINPLGKVKQKRKRKVKEGYDSPTDKFMHMSFPYSVPGRDARFTVDEIIGNHKDIDGQQGTLKERFPSKKSSNFSSAHDEEETDEDDFLDESRDNQIDLQISELNQDIDKDVNDTTVYQDLAKFEEIMHKITLGVSKQEVYDRNGLFSEEDCRKVLDIDRPFTTPLRHFKIKTFGPLNRGFLALNRFYRLWFNIFTWHDPMATFWFIILLIVLIVFFAFFPWRLFLFAVGIALVGPQNYLFFRRKGELEENVDNYISDANTQNNIFPSNTSNVDVTNINEQYDRSGSSLKIVIPEGAVRNERFYDWPPDPRLSTATRVEDKKNFFKKFSSPLQDSSWINLTRSKYSTHSNSSKKNN